MDILPFVSFLIALSSLLIFRKIALKFQWVDFPSVRKQHTGTPPLCGGASIFITLQVALFIHPLLLPGINFILICATILFITGVADDKYNIDVKVRLLIQSCVAYLMVMYGECRITDLGLLFGAEKVTLSGSNSTVISMLAIVGGINAFNMIDGIDGLLGGMTIVCFASLGYLFNLYGMSEIVLLCSIIIVATLPFLVLNSGIFCSPKHKVFMGDAGSTLLGFLLIWLLIIGSQPLNHHTNFVSNAIVPTREVVMNPVTALWVIAIPLIDMVTVMVHRIRRGRSPFLPDRTHLHHILLKLGLNAQFTSLLICILGAILAIGGIFLEVKGIPEHIQFITFLILFCSYFLISQYIFKIKHNLRKAYLINYKL